MRRVPAAYEIERRLVEGSLESDLVTLGAAEVVKDGGTSGIPFRIID